MESSREKKTNITKILNECEDELNLIINHSSVSKIDDKQILKKNTKF